MIKHILRQYAVFIFAITAVLCFVCIFLIFRVKNNTSDTQISPTNESEAQKLAFLEESTPQPPLPKEWEMKDCSPDIENKIVQYYPSSSQAENCSDRSDVFYIVNGVVNLPRSECYAEDAVNRMKQEGAIINYVCEKTTIGKNAVLKETTDFGDELFTRYFFLDNNYLTATYYPGEETTVKDAEALIAQF